MVTKGGSRDTVTGAIVVAVAALALVLVYIKDASKAGQVEGYSVTARFNRLDGISIGSPVRLSGVKIGSVVEETLDPEFRAVTRLQIADDVALPADSTAVIRTDGLLGAKYIEIGPGGDDRPLKDGDNIIYTQDSMVIEDLLELIIVQGKGKRGYADRPLPSSSSN
ncbi:MAG: ABC-type transport system involved in resistance to organic solvent periplasmic [Rhodospirillaceae bacterium]|nr:MAG: ABC-type transport system involved in resistance to organic solvent periplasmic [Rhodospirillaceae bacterium]TNC98862.1 MAG: ABC-type transport system involved in resistance to organic solvent periplasmic component [Stygiobacter sp.]